MASLAKILDLPALRILRDAAATVRASLFFGTPILALAVLAFLTVGHRLRRDLAITIAVAVVSVVLVALICLRLGPRLLNVDPYECLTSESVLLVEKLQNHHKYTYSRELLVKARRSGVRLVECAWHWTGQSSDEYKIDTMFKNLVLFDGRRPEEDHRVYRWIYLGHALSKGETDRVGYVLSVEDDVQAMRPFLVDNTGDYTTRHLKTTVRFPRSEEPAVVEAITFDRRTSLTAIAPDIDVARSLTSGTNAVDFTISVVAPKRWLRYGVRWRDG